MDKKVIIAIVVIAVAVVAIPLVGKLTPKQAAPAPPAPALQPPALDAAKLTNTKWALSIKGIALTVSFLPGGKATAQAPMLKALTGSDTAEGTWNLDGANLTVTANAGGKTHTGKFQISGDQILVDGKPASRVP